MRKVKKKELLERIENLEKEIQILKHRMEAPVETTPVVHLPLGMKIITGKGNCDQCGMDLNHGGTCMCVSCPYSLKITC